VCSGSIESNVEDARIDRQQGDGIMCAVGVCPAYGPGIQFAAHLAGKHSSQVAAATAEFPQSFSI
jgi:hypothetical protein